MILLLWVISILARKREVIFRLWENAYKALSPGKSNVAVEADPG